VTDAALPGPLEIAARPVLDAAGAARLAEELFGATGPVRELGSQQDRNFHVATPGGPRVLKVANRVWGREALGAQNAALLHVAGAGFDAPAPVASRDGSLLLEVDVAGEVLPVRLLTFVEGSPLSDAGYLSPAVVADLGRLAGRTAQALAGFEHPGLDRVGQWDLRRASDVVAALLPSVADPARRELVAARTSEAQARVDAVAASLRLQAIHGDVTDDNVVGERDEAGRVRPAGVIDFGDLGRSWLVAELAVACSSVLRHRPEEPLAVLDAVRAFHEVVPLQDDEIAALWPLVVLRGATLVVAGQHQASLDPDNASATDPLESEWRIFEVAQSVPYAVAEAAVRAALGLGRPARLDAAAAALQGAGRLLPDVAASAVVDLSATSESLHGGRFLALGAEQEVLGAAAAGHGAAVTRFGEARLTRTRALSAEAPATVALGVDLVVPPGSRACAPWDVVVAAYDGGTLVLGSPAGRVLLEGVADGPEAGAVVRAGERLGSVDDGRVSVRISLDADLEVPAFVPASERPAWRLLAGDPSPLLGVDVGAEDVDVHGLLERRDRVFARVQEHYYTEPMRIERGWQHLLVDTDGRCYVDMVNNVAAVGHGHPRLADAVDRQMRLLNTNSRFHYEAVALLSERLAELAPAGLDTVFLVNSGSEAVDLALRMAQVVTDRLDVVATHESYHGWTYLSDAVTTSLYDNPRALETRPDWVHLASAPNPFRGRFRGEGAGAAYGEELRQLVERLAVEGRAPAAYICEPVLGNAGGVMLPDGYLGAAYDAVRSVGGLCIADEVQVGYGRTGHHWWAYEMHDVRPDFITIAKAMGNGQPLGAVITSRAIADAFAANGSFFSSAGGSPVSCVVGLTVLDIIEDEQLQQNAAEVGDHLVARCTELMERHPIVGAVHGMGLYLGVELVRDRETLDPATAECYAICDRLRELGIVVQPTGERANVLKMKPPMVLTREAADFYVDQLERVLLEGW
jgi:4-aminobutyrate aminotransferase-like enzyme/Ser/Thr protein kinase RdoA (MazF antagonist)